MKINAWSHARLLEFEKCPFKAKLKYIDRIPEPERPLPPGKKEHANDRGSRVHKAAELYVSGQQETLPVELNDFAHEMEKLRSLYQEGKVSLEEEWAIDQDWEPTTWFAEDV